MFVLLFVYLSAQAAIIGTEGRRTEDEYASVKSVSLASVQSRFAATGRLICDGGTLSANLTGANNILTTAAHGFFKRATCTAITRPETCRFVIKVGDTEQVVTSVRLIAHGLNCAGPALVEDDWAVLKIAPSIRGVRPYDLPDDEIVQRGDAIVSVSSGAHDFRRRDPVTPSVVFPKSIDECNVQYTRMPPLPSSFESDCESGRGSSGGAVLVTRGHRDVLLGITQGNYESGDDLARSLSGALNFRPYSYGLWATNHVILNREFLSAVKSAISAR